MSLAKIVTGVMLISRNLHRDINKLIFTLCTVIKRLMQKTLDEVELS